MSSKIRWSGAVLGVLGLALVLAVHWQVFFWVSTERTMGVVQRIFYIHVPAAWVAFLAFGIVAIFPHLLLARMIDAASIPQAADNAPRGHQPRSNVPALWLTGSKATGSSTPALGQSPALR